MCEVLAGLRLQTCLAQALALGHWEKMGCMLGSQLSFQSPGPLSMDSPHSCLHEYWGAVSLGQPQKERARTGGGSSAWELECTHLVRKVTRAAGGHQDPRGPSFSPWLEGDILAP